MNTIIRIKFVLSLLLLASCSTLSVDAPKDYKDLIVGIWAESITSKGDVYFYNTYFSNGKSQGYGYFREDYTGEYFYGEGSWEIVNNHSCITVSFASNFFENGHKWCDRIIKLDEKVFIYESDGLQITMHRVSNGKIKL